MGGIPGKSLGTSHVVHVSNSWIEVASITIEERIAMVKNFPRSGKKLRPKTAIKGKRYRCAICHKRSPKPVKIPAPWYCPACASQAAMSD